MGTSIKFTSIIFTALAWVFGSVLAQPSNDPYSAAPKNVAHPILLKLNYNYLLFTYPVAPYRDPNGSVMVPLRVVGELMGGQVYNSKPRKTGTLIRPDLVESHLLEFVAGSRQALIDDKTVQLASAPIWLADSDELLVPLEPLIKTFGLRPHWNPKTSVLALGSILFEYIETFERETLPYSYQDTEQLIPGDVSLKRQGPSARQIKLTMNLKDVSNTPIRAGQQGVFLLAQYGGIGDTFVEGRNTEIPTIGTAPTDPCRREKTRGFSCTAMFPAISQAIYNAISGSYPLDYLIARVRVRIP